MEDEKNQVNTADSESQDNCINRYEDMDEIEFDIKFGYKDKDGSVHKHVIMERMTGDDNIRLRKDRDLVELSRQNYDVNSGNPINKSFATNASLEMYIIVLSFMIKRIGTIEIGKDRNKISKLTTHDINIMVEHMCELNGVNIQAIKEAQKNDPFFFRGNVTDMLTSGE